MYTNINSKDTLIREIKDECRVRVDKKFDAEKFAEDVLNKISYYISDARITTYRENGYIVIRIEGCEIIPHTAKDVEAVEDGFWEEELIDYIKGYIVDSFKDCGIEINKNDIEYDSNDSDTWDSIVEDSRYYHTSTTDYDMDVERDWNYDK